MKTGFKIALPILVFLVGAGLGHVHKHHKLRIVADAAAQAQRDEDDAKATACRVAGGMPIYGCFRGRLAGCYQKK